MFVLTLIFPTSSDTRTHSQQVLRMMGVASTHTRIAGIGHILFNMLGLAFGVESADLGHALLLRKDHGLGGARRCC
jgi:hypothetical protein